MIGIDSKGRLLRRVVAKDLTWAEVLGHLADNQPPPGCGRVMLHLAAVSGGRFNCATLDREENPPSPETGRGEPC